MWQSRQGFPYLQPSGISVMMKTKYGEIEQHENMMLQRYWNSKCNNHINQSTGATCNGILISFHYTKMKVPNVKN